MVTLYLSELRVALKICRPTYRWIGPGMRGEFGGIVVCSGRCVAPVDQLESVGQQISLMVNLFLGKPG